MGECGIIPPELPSFGPVEWRGHCKGCPLPSGHGERHLCETPYQGMIEWESDLCPEEECDCDGDWYIAWKQAEVQP